MYDTGKGDKTYVIRAAGYEHDFRVNSISEQAAIDTENAIRQGNLSGPHMQNIMEIESVPTLKKMRNTKKTMAPEAIRTITTGNTEDRES